MQIKKFKIPRHILYILALAIFLNILRIILFGNNTFIYIFWNIFLAFVSFFISSILLLNTDKENIIKPLFIIGFILWILFLPNAPYVVTDFIHLGRIRAVPVMYDMFLLFSAAYASLLLGLYSISHMEKILLLKFTKKITNILILIIILFTGFGVYLGRFLRFNSWDFFINHNSLVTSIWKISTESNGYANVFGYTLLFFIFIYVSYLSFKSANVK